MHLQANKSEAFLQEVIFAYIILLVCINVSICNTCKVLLAFILCIERLIEVES